MSCTTALGKVGSLLSSVRGGGGNANANVNVNAPLPRLGKGIVM